MANIAVKVELEAFALCHFLPARQLADTPAVRPPSDRSARAVRTLNFQNKRRI